MPGVFGGKPFSVEDVAEVAVAVIAENLGAAPVGVGFAAHGTRYLVVETGPTAAAVELVGGAVERGVAAAADVRAGSFMQVILAGEGHFRAFPEDYPFLFRGERIEVHSLFQIVFDEYFPGFLCFFGQGVELYVIGAGESRIRFVEDMALNAVLFEDVFRQFDLKKLHRTKDFYPIFFHGISV